LHADGFDLANHSVACGCSVSELRANQFAREALPIPSNIANELLFNLGRSRCGPEIRQAIPIRIALKIAIGDEISLRHHAQAKKDKKANL
jgi:hypothetical protein